MSDSESRLMIELDDMSLTDLIAAEKVAESELQTGSILSVIACNHCGKLSVEPSKTGEHRALPGYRSCPVGLAYAPVMEDRADGLYAFVKIKNKPGI